MPGGCTVNDSAYPAEAGAGVLGSTDQNPAGVGLWGLIREDWRTHGGRWLAHGFWVLALHRLGNWRMGFRWRAVRGLLTVVYQGAYPVVEAVTGIKLCYTVRVGRRVRIEHFGGMVLGAESIGDECVIRQNTTFGVRRTGSRAGKPRIGNRVDIGCGAVILGPVEVGDDAVIGANAVVIRDVAAGSVVGGVPARVIRE